MQIYEYYYRYILCYEKRGALCAFSIVCYYMFSCLRKRTYCIKFDYNQIPCDIVQHYATLQKRVVKRGQHFATTTLDDVGSKCCARLTGAVGQHLLEPGED